jgi:phosphoenolpyruvate carboxylase
MIMALFAAQPGPMGESMPSPTLTSPTSQRVTRLLGERLELVEDLWETVLHSECPAGQAERLLRLKHLSDPSEEDATTAIVQLIREMDLAEAIAAARAFSLYFQLVNIQLPRQPQKPAQQPQRSLPAAVGQPERPGHLSPAV